MKWLIIIVCGFFLSLGIIIRADVLSGENFDVYYKASDKRLAQDVLNYANSAKVMIEDSLGYSLQKISINLERPPVDRYSRDYKAYINKAYYDPIPLRRQAFPNKVIAHELIHIATYQMLGDKKALEMPRWFFEGLSAYLSGYPRGIPIHKLVSNGELLPLNKLRGDWGNPIGKLAQTGYSEGRLTVEYLVSKKEGILQKILQMMKNQKSFSDAISTYYEISLQDFEKQAFDYLYHIGENKGVGKN
jgi:hypothetical protein